MGIELISYLYHSRISLNFADYFIDQYSWSILQDLSILNVFMSEYSGLYLTESSND